MFNPYVKSGQVGIGWADGNFENEVKGKVEKMFGVFNFFILIKRIQNRIDFSGGNW